MRLDPRPELIGRLGLAALSVVPTPFASRAANALSSVLMAGSCQASPARKGGDLREPRRGRTSSAAAMMSGSWVATRTHVPLFLAVSSASITRVALASS